MDGMHYCFKAKLLTFDNIDCELQHSLNTIEQGGFRKLAQLHCQIISNYILTIFNCCVLEIKNASVVILIFQKYFVRSVAYFEVSVNLVKFPGLLSIFLLKSY